jgi:isopenicillin N synthase-like dioxygenase
MWAVSFILNNIYFFLTQIEETFATSMTFFENPVEVKQKYARPVDHNHGWVSLEREK